MNGPGLVVYGVAYYELQPPYKCHYSTADTSDNPAMIFYQQPQTDAIQLRSDDCTYETVCDAAAMDTTLIGWSVNKKGKFYLDNWIE